MKLFKFFMVAAFALVASALSVVAQASTETAVSIANDAPSWVYAAIAAVGVIAGFVAQLDAQVSEDFKRKWPWWARLVWDWLAGNYKHSRNIGSQ
ncbi:hypothetical protein [Vibrio aestuarianus]|uniref:Uncharacterized protein n=1 Tax=Vibrio aestuarianus TaxID=28171 RepID=A0ABD7YQ70_9VIBR|nr:hypothetical protein [Vibrio aestuarianus]WGK87242.1 hypothetical protein PYE67_14050 [Vibrio aestuarianus]CAH8235314.1 conserved exported hypothetical protein [Vibrio aestuarianus]